MLKEDILNLLTMRDITDKLGIKVKHNMCSCSFGHTDKNPSMKIYEKSFYCFSCNKTGDLIQFVQYYYNISFKDAMKKINEDFNLHLTNSHCNKEKIKQIEQEKFIKQQKKRKQLEEYINLCQQRINCIESYKNSNTYINSSNWEEKVLKKSQITDKIHIIDMKLDDLEDKF